MSADTALTPAQVHQIFQGLTISMLGLPLPAGYSQVRVEWPPEGQPGWPPETDRAFIGATLQDSPIDKQRDLRIISNDDTNVHEETTYERVWNVDWILYGNDFSEWARLIRKGLFQQANHDALAASNLAMVTAIPQARLIRDNFVGQWWNIAYLNAQFNELVTETSEQQYVTSAEVIVETADGTQVADITVEEEE